MVSFKVDHIHRDDFISFESQKKLVKKIKEQKRVEKIFNDFWKVY